MKKILAITLCVLLVVGLAACGSPASSESQAPSESAQESEAASAESQETPPEDTGSGNAPAGEGEVIVSQGGKEVVSANGKGFEDIHIAVIQQNATATASIMLYNALEEYAAEYYPEVKYTLVNGEGDAAFQAELMDQFIAQGVDVITLNAADAEVVLGSVQDAIDAGIPVVNVGAVLTEELGQYNAISENAEAGELQMKYVCENLLEDGKGDIVIMRGQDGHQATTDRSKGYENILADYPDVNVVFEDTGEWARDVGMNLMENWLQSGQNIDVVVAQNDEMAMGAYDAVAAVGKEDAVLVTSIDFSEGGAEYTRDGKFACNVLQNAPEEGRSTFQLAVELALGNDPDDAIIPFELITPENINDYLEAFWPNLLQ